MTDSLYYFAAEASDDSIFGALGIDVQMLIFQGIGFLILVWLLAKFVFPPLLKSVDDRQAKIEDSVKAATDAKKSAENAEAKVEETLKQARSDAAAIVSTAKDEATAAIEAAEAKAKQRSQKIIDSAHEQIDKDIVAAKKALHNETIELVALATEKVIDKTVTDKVDSKIIARAIEESR